MRVREVMTSSPISVAPEASLREVAELLGRHRISGLPVVEATGVVGVVSAADIVRKEQEFVDDGDRRGLLARLRRRPRRASRTAGEAMRSPAVVVGPGTSLTGAAWLMTTNHISRLPVVERDKLIGIVTRKDLVRAFARSDEQIHEEIVKDVLPSLGLSANDVGVSVLDGTAKLHGAVEDELDARCLPHAVRAVVGVVDVEADLIARHEHPWPRPDTAPMTTIR